MTLIDVRTVLENNNVNGNIPRLEVQLKKKIIKFAITDDGKIKFQIQDNSTSTKTDVVFLLEEDLNNCKYNVYFHKSYNDENYENIKEYNKSYSKFDDAIIKTIKDLYGWF